MAGRSHPTYPNPTVVEAVCEIHFGRSPDKPWKPSLPGELFKVVQDDYPEIEPVVEVGVQLEFGPSGVGQHMLPPRQRVRLKHRERPILLQIGEDVLTVNFLRPYPGWDEVKNTVLSTWRRAAPVLGASAISRIGLRYINRIPLAGGESIAKWLTATRLVPEAIVSSKAGFFSRVEAGLGPGDRVVATIGEEPGAEGGGPAAIIFDIDRITERELAPSDGPLAMEIDRLHQEVWDAFAAAMTQDLEDLLSRNPS